MTLSLIASVARNGAIGRGNALVWDEPADKQLFRRTTMGCPVMMGRKTWDSLPPRFRPLPGRSNMVVTRQAALAAPRARRSRTSLDDALALVADGAKVFVIGGASSTRRRSRAPTSCVLTEIDRGDRGRCVLSAMGSGCVRRGVERRACRLSLRDLQAQATHWLPLP